MSNYRQPPPKLKSTCRSAKHLKKSNKVIGQHNAPPKPPKDYIPNGRCKFASHKKIRDRLNKKGTKEIGNSLRGQRDTSLK